MPRERAPPISPALPPDIRLVSAALARLDPACAPWGRGWCAAAAGILEATAAKPGNVHPAASFPDLSHADLVAAALAAAPAMQGAEGRPLGATILAAVQASRSAARSNANLGILLLVAPLAAVPAGQRPSAAAADAVLAGLSRHDAVAIWEAIAIANPGGMGTTPKWDVRGPAPDDIRAAMRLAAERDQIARLWALGYEPLFTGAVADLLRGVRAGLPLLEAIVECFLAQLAREPDSLIVRRHGPDVAARVAARADELLALPAGRRADAVAAFDRSLRQPARLNPGTTADIVAAAVYILLADDRLRPRAEPGLPPLPEP